MSSGIKNKGWRYWNVRGGQIVGWVFWTVFIFAWLIILVGFVREYGLSSLFSEIGRILGEIFKPIWCGKQGCQ